jgi:hypothetical protein
MNTLDSHRNKPFLKRRKCWFPNLTHVGQVRALRFRNSCHSDIWKRLRTRQMSDLGLFQSYKIHNIYVILLSRVCSSHMTTFKNTL